ncbi:MAG TPA: efflux RND transporter periplasmic adaptor subunit [Opitutaceae bacterium]|nr:efflux RND transporter periplasmic adaptor subunit [Opitutaceae bacterium]
MSAPAPVPPPSPRRKGGTRWIIAAAVVLLLVLGGLAVWKRSHAPKGTPVTTERAVVRDITQVVTATGKIQPEVEVIISPEDFGEITALPFDDGDHVKKGDLIVKIKPDLYQAQVDQQTAAVTAARSASTRAKATLEKAVSDFNQYQDLHQRHLVSDADYVTYKTACDVAKADYASSLAAVNQAEGFLAQAKDALSKTVIYSPITGTVTSRSCQVGQRVVATGSFAGTEIMRVADLSHMEVWVNVNEDDVPNVRVGNRVVISVDAYPDRKFEGTVKEIESSAAGTGATGSGSAAQSAGASSNDITNFVVKITVTDRDAHLLRPGMSATADIQTQSVHDVVAVPIQSVTVRAAGGLSAEEMEAKKAKEQQEKTGNQVTAAAEKRSAKRDQQLLRRVVFLRSGDKVKLVPVETGIADDTWIEVKSGVKAGDEVVSGTYAAISRTLKDGAAIRVERPKKAEGAN